MASHLLALSARRETFTLDGTSSDDGGEPSDRGWAERSARAWTTRCRHEFPRD